MYTKIYLTGNVHFSHNILAGVNKLLTALYFWKQLSLANGAWIKQIQINFIQMVYILYEF